MPERRSKKAPDEERPLALPPPGPLPKVIYAQASPRSSGGTSLFAMDSIDVQNVGNFFADSDTTERAAAQLRAAGFDVLQVTPLTINIAGSADTYRRAFGIRLEAQERMVIKPGIGVTSATFIECPDTQMAGFIATDGTSLAEFIEGVAIEEPRYFLAASAFAPPKAYWHLDVPGDVSLGCNADRAHRAGYTGRGVRVAMVDSGHFAHPFFAGRGYRVEPVTLGPATANPQADENGHGTAESANIFAVAPDVKLLPVKVNFVNSTGAFNTAVGLKPHIITCSWGSHAPFGPLSAADLVLAAAIANAVASGITVVFSAGNGHAGFPGQHPDVISAGGAYMRPDGTFEASNYSSGFKSNIYPGRSVPDLCGLVGMQPGASYIMLPLEPGDQIDVSRAGGVWPPQDETAGNDGWAAISGTSAAAPQLAGAAALVKQACPQLSPTGIRTVLMRTARDVTQGNCNAVQPLHGGLPASAGTDTATGRGVVDAFRAAITARLQCILSPFPQPPSLAVDPTSAPEIQFAGMHDDELATMVSDGLGAQTLEALETFFLEG